MDKGEFLVIRIVRCSGGVLVKGRYCMWSLILLLLLFLEMMLMVLRLGVRRVKVLKWLLEIGYGCVGWLGMFFWDLVLSRMWLIVVVVVLVMRMYCWNIFLIVLVLKFFSVNILICMFCYKVVVWFIVVMLWY